MTTDKQPKACEVPLLELLESIPNNVRVRAYTEDGMSTTHYPVVHLCRKAAAELRRLHEVNAELVEALRELLFEEESQDNGLTEAVIMSHDEFVKFMSESVRSYESAKEKARKVLAKATGENNG